jgi:RNA polymerase sigma factor (sigma-70 family)
MLQYAAGNERAFAELYERYRSRAYGYLSRRIKSPGGMDELFQQIFFKLYRSLEMHRSDHLFSTWFFTICRNVVIDEFRRIKRTPLNVELEEEHLEDRSVTEQVRPNGFPQVFFQHFPNGSEKRSGLSFYLASWLSPALDRPR